MSSLPLWLSAMLSLALFSACSQQRSGVDAPIERLPPTVQAEGTDSNVAIEPHDPHPSRVPAGPRSDVGSGVVASTPSATRPRQTNLSSAVRQPTGNSEGRQNLPYATAGIAGDSPSDCTGASTITRDDFVLDQDKTSPGGQSNFLNLVDGWRADEAWGNGRLQLATLADGAAISFSNEGIYHGFKFTPALVNGVRRTFTLRGAEVYLQLERVNNASSAPTFGLRLIKPGEFEGNGGAPTTTWMLAEPAGGSRFLTAPSRCTLVKMYTPQGFIKDQGVANRLIWEMQSNWSPSDKLLIRRIVLKGFRYVP